MKNINCIPRSVTNSSIFLILTMKNKLLKSRLVNPVLFSHHAKGRVNPPRVANIGQFLWSTIKAPFASLSLAQPLCQHLLIKRLNAARYFESPHTAKHISSMRFSIGNTTKRSVKISTAKHILNSLLLINFF